MMKSLLRGLGKGLKLLWQALNAGRRVFGTLLFLFFLVTLVALYVYHLPPRLETHTALILDLRGNLVEQHAMGKDALAWMTLPEGLVNGDTQLRDVLTVVDAAAHDPNISSLVLQLDHLQSAGLPMLREISLALEKFKARGKPVIAWGAGYDQRQYYLAVHANTLYLDPMGQVFLEGFGHYRNYYRDALDKLGITVNLMRVGTYKSFAEPFIANAPSPAASEAERTLYDALWKNYTGSVETARKLPHSDIQHRIDDLPRLLALEQGDSAKLARSLNWVDDLKTREEFNQVVIRQGAANNDDKAFRQISFEDYLARQAKKWRGPAIAVIVAEGEIRDGESPPGAIGGESTARLIEQARDDDQIKALVLRVNSPGGSAYASELIRRELEQTRAAGKPVVISMGNVAASGGYWISMSSDEVIADPDTLTGSIGVFALFPTADKLMAKLGIHSAGVTTTWLSDARNPLRPLDPRFGAMVQESVRHTYDEFTDKAAKARKTSPQKIEAVAQGRVWTGQQALERGLIDRVGNFGDALHSAATLAHLPQEARLVYFEAESPGLEGWLQRWGVRAPEWIRVRLDPALLTAASLSESAAEWRHSLVWLSELLEGRKSFVALTHCLCEAP